MRALLKTVLQFAAAIILCGAPALGQFYISPADIKTFDKDGLKFSYPADWTLIDKSTAGTQILSLSKPNSLVLISIVSPRQIITNYEQYRTVQNQINDRYVIAIKQGLNSKDKYTEEETHCLDFNGRNVIGRKFTGAYKAEPSIGEVFPFVLGDRFISLIYMHSIKRSAETEPVWNDLLRSLHLQNSNRNAAIPAFEAESVSTTEMASRVEALAEMFFSSPETRYGYVAGSLVRIVVDEKGKVIAAEGNASDVRLRAAAEHAAKLSKFRPSIVCGKPVKYTGVLRFATKAGYIPVR